MSDRTGNPKTMPKTVSARQPVMQLDVRWSSFEIFLLRVLDSEDLLTCRSFLISADSLTFSSSIVMLYSFVTFCCCLHRHPQRACFFLRNACVVDGDERDVVEGGVGVDVDDDRDVVDDGGGDGADRGKVGVDGDKFRDNDGDGEVTVDGGEVGDDCEV